METTFQELQQAVDEQKPEVKQEISKFRQFLVETDGKDIKISKNEWTNLELISGLSIILNKLQNKNV